MLVVPTDSNPFKWSEIHSLAKAKLEALDQTIREEIQTRLEPLPASGGARHQFFVLLSERVDHWATRAKTAYLECLAQIGREPSHSINQSIWENGLKFFITDEFARKHDSGVPDFSEGIGLGGEWISRSAPHATS
jgi:hypothetical protein